MFCQQKISSATQGRTADIQSENLAPASINAAIMIVASAAPNFIS